MERILVGKRNLDYIPKSIKKALNIQPGDVLEFKVENDKIIITPMKTVPAEQTWFWNRVWQEGEKEAEEDIKLGRVKQFHSMKDLLEDLDV
ncbi:MAG: AbrB family transcriptional regulator [Firmicutes bacterium HGW-Firmicutes-14]|nr:MAG: AbrB family transcriptional regulator [Firmicutes bacterium HGW-Firmicutes-14]